MAQKFDIPDYLKIDARTAASLQKEQARLRDKYGYDSQAIRNRGQAAANQTIYEREIVLASEGLASLAEHDPGNEEAITREKRRLAENLMKTGKLSEALAVAADEIQSDQIRAIQHAIDIPDNQRCACEDDFVNGVHITRHIEQGSIFSDKHRAIVPIVVCSKCGHANAGAKVPARPKLDKLFPRGRPNLKDVVRSR